MDGQVALTKEGLSPLESQPTCYELGILRRGEIFGEMSFVDGKPSAVSFMTKCETLVAVVDLSASRRRSTTRRLRDVVTNKLRHHLTRHADESMTLRVNTLQLENEFSAYRNGVGHIVVATLCLLSFYTLTLSFLPNFKSLAHANFALTPVVILLFGTCFVPIIATSGFPLRFFGLSFDNWRPALAYSLRASLFFLALLVAAKWVLISTSDSLAGVPLIDSADVEVSGHPVPMTTWYWFALAIYLLLTPLQEFVARSGIQAPLYAFLHGSELKRRWFSILAFEPRFRRRARPYKPRFCDRSLSPRYALGMDLRSNKLTSRRNRFASAYRRDGDVSFRDRRRNFQAFSLTFQALAFSWRG